MTTSALGGPLELLVLQPTPFCNIDCSYCYLPDRQSTRQMSLRTLEQTLHWIFASGLVRGPFTILWHAGEPLVMPVAFYQQAGELIERCNRQGVPIRQSFQTNATLLSKEWCAFLLEKNIHLGVSVDGPAFLHDRYRRTRQGKGTLDRVLAGIRLLHDHQVPFDVISVLTASALDCPDELFDFYRAHGIRSVAFNVEEIEGPHVASTLLAPQTEQRFRRFLNRFFDLACSVDPPMVVREFTEAATAIRCARGAPLARTQENKPFAIVNVDCEGNFSTWSPELLGLASPRHGSFALGHVGSTTLADVRASQKYQLLDAEISRGVDLCHERCPYFAVCGGGAPGNKYFENGDFASTETLFCRLHVKACIDVTLTRLEREIAAGNSAAAPYGRDRA